MVGTCDQIKVRKVYSHYRPIQFVHTCLIISLHGVVVFFVIIECADKYYVYMTILCNNGENPKLPNARGTTVRYHGCVISVVLQPDIQHGKRTDVIARGIGLSSQNIDQWVATLPNRTSTRV